jgi:hypothetical protein
MEPRITAAHLDSLKRLIEKSSQIAGIHYDAPNKRMIVEFRSSPQKYAYLDVPANLFANLCRSDSAGSFIARRVKPYFKAEKLEPGAL